MTFLTSLPTLEPSWVPSSSGSLKARFVSAQLESVSPNLDALGRLPQEILLMILDICPDLASMCGAIATSYSLQATFASKAHTIVRHQTDGLSREVKDLMQATAVATMLPTSQQGHLYCSPSPRKRESFKDKEDEYEKFQAGV